MDKLTQHIDNLIILNEQLIEINNKLERRNDGKTEA